MIMVFLNYLHSLSNLLYNTLFKNYSKLRDSYSYQFFVQFFSQLFVPFVDFLTAVTLLYLFYYQGMQILRKDKKLSKSN